MPQKDCFERRWTPHEKQIRLIHHAVHIWLLPERRRDRLTAEVTSHILLPGILKLGRARDRAPDRGLELAAAGPLIEVKRPLLLRCVNSGFDPNRS
jgi:hypothetical protein